MSTALYGTLLWICLGMLTLISITMLVYILMPRRKRVADSWRHHDL